uniref:E2 ubiquitin-conjugating enzyme n=1 Tax=Glossina pallidipes TaxID=7398 RepID=A0A1B0A7C6_GLOPL
MSSMFRTNSTDDSNNNNVVGDNGDPATEHCSANSTVVNNANMDFDESGARFRSTSTVSSSKSKKKTSSTSSRSARRIQRELTEMANDRSSIYSAGLKEDNLYEWDCVILGPMDTVYEGGTFFLDLRLSHDYPFAPPKVAFRTRIYHCNVNSHGAICVDILRHNWSPALTIAKVLLSICSLLADCNPMDPLDYRIAKPLGLHVSKENCIISSKSKSNQINSVSLSRSKSMVTIMSTSANVKEQEQQHIDAELRALVKRQHREQPTCTAESLTTEKSLIILAATFVISFVAMRYIYMISPELNESEKQHMKIPRDIQGAKMLGKVLDRYKDMYYFQVMFGVVAAYIFLQTFAIPGSLFLSILLGFLYRFPIALFLICFCSTLGATLCYCLSSLIGRRLIKYFWPRKISEWSKHIENHRDNLFNYMLFVRMSPILPNWFINVAAPVIGVPIYPFTLGTFCGVAPPSMIAIQAGKTLQKMSNSSDAFSWTSVSILTICACVSLVPSILKHKLKKKTQ